MYLLHIHKCHLCAVKPGSDKSFVRYELSFYCNAGFSEQSILVGSPDTGIAAVCTCLVTKSVADS